MKAYTDGNGGCFFLPSFGRIYRLYNDGTIKQYPDNWIVIGFNVVHSDDHDCILATEMADNWLSRAIIAEANKQGYR